MAHRRCIFIGIAVFTLCTTCVGYPAEEENPDISYSAISRVKLNDLTPVVSKAVDLPKVARQDGEAVGEDAGIGNVIADRITTILLGVLSGNLNSIFSGSTGFVADNEAQNTVNGILGNVAKPINTISDMIVKNTLQRLNLTSTSPRTAEMSGSATAETIAKSVPEEEDSEDEDTRAKIVV